MLRYFRLLGVKLGLFALVRSLKRIQLRLGCCVLCIEVVIQLFQLAVALDLRALAVP